jgi:protein-L-isoaspartate(D-aspartate) O-methyltransferase
MNVSQIKENVMYSCPSCGIDVKKPGLCIECTSSKKTKTKKSDLLKSKKKTNRFILWVAIYFLMGCFGFFFSYLVFGNIPKSTSETDSASDKERIKTVETIDKIVQTDITSSVIFDIAKRTDHPPVNTKSDYTNWMIKHTKEKEKFIDWRWECIQDLISWKSLKDPKIIEAFLRTPRENFIRTRNLNRAYDHAYMEIGYGATITDPWIVSIMTQAINPQPTQKVLEIGTGSGYQSALLSELTNFVFTIEIIEALAKETDDLYKSYENDYPEYKNMKRTIGDGYYGWEEYAPFDRIIVTCAIDHIPPFLLKQLKSEGIMVIPVGPPSGQKLLKITKHIEADTVYFDRENIVPRTVKFISFQDKEGKSYSQ